MIRTSKRTSEKATVHTLLAGLILAVVILFAFDPARRLFEHHILGHPWLEATIDLSPSPDGSPDVVYGVKAKTTVSGDWRVWTETADGRRICSQDGPADYEKSQPVEIWSWEGWYINGCDVPKEPYSVCIRYSISTPAWARDVSRPFCSALVGKSGEVNAGP